MLDLVEPLPVRNDRPADDQAAHREHDAGAAVLSLRKTVDLTDHDPQRPIDLRVPVASHPSILLGPSTGHRHSTRVESSHMFHTVSGFSGHSPSAGTPPASPDGPLYCTRRSRRRPHGRAWGRHRPRPAGRNPAVPSWVISLRIWLTRPEICSTLLAPSTMVVSSSVTTTLQAWP